MKGAHGEEGAPWLWMQPQLNPHCSWNHRGSVHSYWRQGEQVKQSNPGSTEAARAPEERPWIWESANPGPSGSLSLIYKMCLAQC